MLKYVFHLCRGLDREVCVPKFSNFVNQAEFSELSTLN